MVAFNNNKWLMAESIDGERQYIIHNEAPRFIGEILDTDDGGNTVENVEWLDSPPPDVQFLAKLMRRAGDAINEYDQRLAADVDFRGKIKKELKAKKMSVPQLARLVNLNPQTIYNYLSGKTELGADSLEEILDQLNID